MADISYLPDNQANNMLPYFLAGQNNNGGFFGANGGSAFWGALLGSVVPGLFGGWGNGFGGGFGGEFQDTLVQEIHHLAVAIARELGVDLEGETPAYLAGDTMRAFADVVCKLGCR